MVRVLYLIALMYVIPIVVLVTFTERAEITGHTNLSSAQGFGGFHPGDNYAVFRKGRFVYIITGLAPARIMERNGMLVRVNTVMNRTMPVMTYAPATAAEEALWRKYF